MLENRITYRTVSISLALSSLLFSGPAGANNEWKIIVETSKKEYYLNEPIFCSINYKNISERVQFLELVPLELIIVEHQDVRRFCTPWQARAYMANGGNAGRPVEVSPDKTAQTGIWLLLEDPYPDPGPRFIFDKPGIWKISLPYNHSPTAAIVLPATIVLHETSSEADSSARALFSEASACLFLNTEPVGPGGRVPEPDEELKMIDSLKQLYKNYPMSPWGPCAALALARFARFSQSKNASTNYDDIKEYEMYLHYIVEDCELSIVREDALVMLIDGYLASTEKLKAKTYAQMFVREYPQSHHIEYVRNVLTNTPWDALSVKPEKPENIESSPRVPPIINFDGIEKMPLGVKKVVNEYYEGVGMGKVDEYGRYLSESFLGNSGNKTEHLLKSKSRLKEYKLEEFTVELDSFEEAKLYTRPTNLRVDEQRSWTGVLIVIKGHLTSKVIPKGRTPVRGRDPIKAEITMVLQLINDEWLIVSEHYETPHSNALGAAYKFVNDLEKALGDRKSEQETSVATVFKHIMNTLVGDLNDAQIGWRFVVAGMEGKDRDIPILWAEVTISGKNKEGNSLDRKYELTIRLALKGDHLEVESIESKMVNEWLRD